MIRVTLSLILLAMLSSSSLAQNTGGVFPPSVAEGHRSLSYRIAVDPENNAEEIGFAQRLHYQQALNSKTMLRLVGQTRKTIDGDFDFDYLQAEFFWQISEDDAPFHYGMRFDARYRDGDRPEQLGVHFMNAFDIGEDMDARLVLLTSRQFGENRSDGINLQTRFQLKKSLGNKRSAGVEMYNMYGNTGNIGGFAEQRHTIGPFFSTPIGNGLSIFANPLIGFSEAAPDLELRLFITRSL